MLARRRRAEATMQAIQDAIPPNHCWGCGTLNPQGLQIKSYLEGDETVCRFEPPPRFMAGPTSVLYGGTIASLIDCHSICTAIADAYRAGGRPIGSEPHLWAVTASLKVDYLAPTPLGQPVELRARVVEAKGRKRLVACTLRSGGRDRARAEVVAVEVPAGWDDPAAAG
ncbi:MAG TPA: PaaI family thioesterase [Anaeromyxobacteraceae bacterium]|nr:PaaI family thioesterase [Anaeromyxobacteraceae bacterium]